MDGAYYGSTGKRPPSYYDDEGSDRNGRQKRRNANTEQLSSPVPSSGETEYRILCPATKIGSIIGKGGSIIKALRLEARSKIKVEDPIPGSDERVIYICSTSKEVRDRDGKSRDRDREGGYSDKRDFLCPAQEALFKVHARIVDSEGAVSDEDDDEPPRQVTARLLVPNNQVGCLIGKGGKIIEQMRREIAAQIRVLPKDQLPVCATPNDELVQLSGDPALVRKALYAISSRLHENPPRERTQGGSFLSQGPTMPSVDSLFSPGSLVPQGSSYLASSTVGGPMMGFGHSLSPLGGLSSSGAGKGWSVGSGVPISSSVGGTHNGRKEGAAEEEFLIRLLCPNEKVGSIIGKGGNAIRKLREETGAKIKVGDPVSDSDERVVHVTSSEYIDSPTSAAVDAAMQVQKRITELMADKDSDIQTATARLLVPSNQIGCLLGKGGGIISEMRKTTRANIRIPPKDELPRCGGENDELVQIMGDQSVVQEALFQVLSRLRGNLFKGRDGGNGGMLPPLSLSGMPIHGSAPMLPTYGGSTYGGMHEPGSPGRMYSLSGLGLSGMVRTSNYSDYGSTGGVASQAYSGRGTKDSRRRQN